MGEQFFDDLAKGLENGTITRRRALKLVGAAALGAALMPVVPKQAEALSRSARRQCRGMGGTPLGKGDCNCGWQCGADISLFSCHGNTDCVCYKDGSGHGFCGQRSGNASCKKNSDCDPGRRCALNTCAGGLCILPCPT
jgi:hypothetical protein